MSGIDKQQGRRQQQVNRAARLVHEALGGIDASDQAKDALRTLWLPAELHARQMDELYGPSPDKKYP